MKRKVCQRVLFSLVVAAAAAVSAMGAEPTERVLRAGAATSNIVREKNYAHRVLQLQQSPDEAVVLLQAFRVGDLGVCAIPFEVFVEIGLELKESSPLSQTMVISHANGSYGYLPTVEQHQ